MAAVRFSCTMRVTRNVSEDKRVHAGSGHTYCGECFSFSVPQSRLELIKALIMSTSTSTIVAIHGGPFSFLLHEGYYHYYPPAITITEMLFK